MKVHLTSYLNKLRSLEVQVGAERWRFLFDTGAGITLISPALAEQLGCRPGGQLTAFRMSGERVSFPRCEGVSLGLAELTLRHPMVGVMDVMPYLPAGSPPVHGVISLESFRDRRVTLDLANSRLIVEQSSSVDPPGLAELDVRASRQAGGASLDLMAAVRAGGGVRWLELDSGCLGPDFILAPYMPRELYLEEPGSGEGLGQAAARGEAPKAGGGPASRPAARPVQLHLQGVGPVGGQARVKEIIYDGVICASVMERWSIILDLPRLRAWIGPPGAGAR